MKQPKWTTETKSYYMIVCENNAFRGAYDTYEEAKKEAQNTDGWYHKGYCYAIALVRRTTDYADGMFFSSKVETTVIDRLVKEDDM